MGGMEETADRVATRLSRERELTIALYTSDPALRREGMPYQVTDLSPERAFLAEPLIESSRLGCNPFRGFSAENFQISRLLLKGRIESALADRPNDQHVLISFFLTKFGFTAQLIAEELGLPHVACIAGSDLNRDAASPGGFATAAFVIEHADSVVVRSREQATRVGKLFHRSHNIHVYGGGLPEGRPRNIWKRGARDHVALVSDCGYSFKKSTHTLADAFGRLRSEGYPVTLTVAGQTQKLEQEYWEAAKHEWRERFHECARFLDHIGKDEVECLLLAGDIYCSPSLGEGSPNGALYALALGMPVIAPLGTSLDDISEPCGDRVSLFRAGDREDFYRRLAAMVSLVQTGLKPMDSTQIESLKRRLVEEESRLWLNIVRTAVTA